MIHFLQVRILHFGNKMKSKVLFFLLGLCLIFLSTSCEGRAYTFSFPLEELEKDIVSIEVVAILDEEGPLVCETVYLVEHDEERQEILRILSETEYHGHTAPRGGKAKYGFKLSYPDKCIIISIARVFITDKNLNYVKDGWRDMYLNESVASLLGRYVSLEGLILTS